MLGVAQIDINENGQRHDNQHVEQVLLTQQRGKPARLGVLIDNAHGIGAKGVFPLGHAIGGQLNGHIVHHQGKQGFVGAESCLEQGGNPAPQRARQTAGGKGHHQKHPAGHGLSAVNHHGGGCDAAHQNLALGADVPEPHFEGRRQAHADAQQHHGISQGDPAPPGGAEGALEHSAVNLQRVELHDGVNDDGAHHKRHGKAGKADEPAAPGCDGVPLDNADQRVLSRVVHAHPPLPVSSSSCRPGACLRPRRAQRR
ncbi:hypothetical protein SDC9_79842 [bioreactor metagenome]|uniref:Uncharacterized protein n=1 Tax=bioreactor metagenome TaxID=1076179 RepID=A0A644YXR5_9ZZZZ